MHYYVTSATPCDFEVVIKRGRLAGNSWAGSVKGGLGFLKWKGPQCYLPVSCVGGRTQETVLTVAV